MSQALVSAYCSPWTTGLGDAESGSLSKNSVPLRLNWLPITALDRLRWMPPNHQANSIVPRSGCMAHQLRIPALNSTGKCPIPDMLHTPETQSWTSVGSPARPDKRNTGEQTPNIIKGMPTFLCHRLSQRIATPSLGDYGHIAHKSAARIYNLRYSKSSRTARAVEMDEIDMLEAGDSSDYTDEDLRITSTTLSPLERLEATRGSRAPPFASAHRGKNPDGTRNPYGTVTCGHSAGE